ncbi:MAG: secretion system protein E [Verrucomicrobia bacterium]|nr:MAG: secretion system protein E [Verrucomicrobiota bacterium]
MEIPGIIQKNSSPIRTLLEAELVNESDFLRELAKHLKLTWYEPVLLPAVKFSFPARLALRHHLIPIAETDDVLQLAGYDPFDYLARSHVRQVLQQPVRFVLSSRKFILTQLRERYGVGADTFEQLLETMDMDQSDEKLNEINILDEDDPEASVMKFVNQIMREALAQRATDIHVEPLGGDLRIRYRVDGVLRETPIPPQIALLQDSVISRLKIMANLDIAERRMPQDGRISLQLAGQPIDVRVATIPSVNGETISLRLLGQEIFNFARLGVNASLEATLRELLALPNGIILLTGPTGCGKSTSLYTFLASLNTQDRRIVTIEDPVEHKLSGIIQIAIKPEIGLTFASALRSVLRGDPNVIMVGEMRDPETAETAIRAALTGHLVFSTLHTNDSIGGITRLIDMGVEPFLVGSAVRAFIAQRLLRRLCPHCKIPDESDFQQELGFSANSPIFKPVGCEACGNTGYQGRIAIYELCRVTSALQHLIQHKAPTSELKELAMSEGMRLLRENGWERVREGITSLAEVLRVTTAETHKNADLSI